MMPAPIPEEAHWVRVPRFFGDALMIHAALASLRAAAWPLVMWGPDWVVDLFRGHEDYLAVVEEGTRKYSPWQARDMLRRHRAASVINFPKSQRPLWAAFLARTPLRLGCGDGGGWILCTHSVRFYARDDHFVERYRSVIRKAFPQCLEPAFKAFRPRAELLDPVEEEKRKLGLQEYVVFAPGANSASKRLDLHLFAGLGQRLQQKGLQVVVLGAGDEDRRLMNRFQPMLPEAIDRVGVGGLAYSAAWIAGAKALVGMDSGLGHLSAASGIPTLSVFGPTRPRHSAPWGPKVRIFRDESLSCLECMEGLCPLPSHPCMSGLSLENLWKTLEEMI